MTLLRNATGLRTDDLKRIVKGAAELAGIDMPGWTLTSTDWGRLKFNDTTGYRGEETVTVQSFACVVAWRFMTRTFCKETDKAAAWAECQAWAKTQPRPRWRQAAQPKSDFEKKMEKAARRPKEVARNLQKAREKVKHHETQLKRARNAVKKWEKALQEHERVQKKLREAKALRGNEAAD